MLTSLLHLPSYATCSHGFTWCSMKSIGSVSLCHKAARCQAALQAASILIPEKRKNGLYASFSYQTIYDRNIPLKSTRIQIWAYHTFTLNNWFDILPSQQSYLTCSSQLLLSETHKSFLHACTPERRTRALAHLFKQSTHIGGQRQQNISFKKNVEVPEMLSNVPSGGASKPHRSKYIGVCTVLFVFHLFMEVLLWKAW